METKRTGYPPRRFAAVGVLIVASVVAIAASGASAQVKPAKRQGTRAAQNKTQRGRRSSKKRLPRSSRGKRMPRTTPSHKPASKPGSTPKAAPGSKTGQKTGKKPGTKGAPKQQNTPPATGEDPEIDPEVQRKIDEMFRMRGQTPPSEVLRRRGGKLPSQGAVSPRRGSSTPPPTPGRRGSSPAASKEASTPLDIAPAEDKTPPEDRMYGFAIKNGTYAQLVEGFARQTGLGVIGNAPVGQVTFVTTEKLTFDEALGRIRMILFNFKSHEPYWLYRTPTHLQITRVTDFYRILPLKRMYPSVKAFRGAHLPDDEIALAVYTPKAGSVANLNQLRDWLPDYVRISALGDQNRLTIFGLVSDINKYLDLIKLFPGEGDDPRVIERIRVQFLSPSDALNKLSTIMNIDGGSASARPAPHGGRGRGDASDLQNIAEPPINIVPYDSQGVLIVRAMKNKIDEMKRVLQYIDVDMSAQNPPPAIIALKHARAEDVVPIVQQLITASSSPGGVKTAPRRPRRSGKSKVGGVAQVATADSITLLVHPVENAIIVLAAEESDFDEVRRFVDMLDVSADVGWTRIALKHGDAEAIKKTLEEMIPTTKGKGAKRGPAPARHQIVLDPAGDGLWYTGSEETLKKVNDIIAIIDVERKPITLHATRLVYRKPSFVVDMIHQWEGTSGGSRTSRTDIAGKKVRRSGVTRAKPAPTSSGSFTADDDKMMLLVICSAPKWDEYLAFIKSVDTPMSLGAPFERLAVQHIDAEKAADELSRIIGTNTFDSSIRMVPSDGSLLVLGANPQDIEQIKVFLAEIDKPSQIEKRTYTIRYAKAGEIKDIIESLVNDAPTPQRPNRPRKRGGVGNGKLKPGASRQPIPVAGSAAGSSELTIIEYGNKLIVRGTPDQHEEIAAIITEFDVRDGQPELKVYKDFPPGVDIEGITETLRSVLTGTKQPQHPGRRAKDTTTGAVVAKGPQFIPQPSSGRLIVIAEPALFPEIERLLDVLRVGSEELKIVVAIIPIKNADAEELVDRIQPILELKVKNLIESGELGGDRANPVASKGKSTLRGRLSNSKTSNDRYHLDADSERQQIVVAAPQVIVDEIRTLVSEFDKPAGKGDVIFKTVNLTNAVPGEMVKALREMTGKTTIRRLNRGKQGKASGASSPTGESLTILEAPGGGAIILRGLEDDVIQAEGWISKLDALSSPDREIKVYEIKTADMTKLFDLIVNVIETPARVGGARIPRRPTQSRKESEDDADTFSTSKSYSSQDVYIQADLIGHTMLVAATAGKAHRIDALIKRFDSPEEEGGEKLASAPPIPKFLYELKYADPLDASWQLEGVLTTLWEPQDQLPQVEAALFGDFIVVRYPDKTRFDELREMIAKYVDVPDPEQLKIVRKAMPAPKGMKPSDVVKILSESIAGVKVVVEDVTPTRQETYGVEEVLPPNRSGGHPCVLPTAFRMATADLLASITAQKQDPRKSAANKAAAKKKRIKQQSATHSSPSPVKRPPPAAKRNREDADTMIRNAVIPIIKEKKVKKKAPSAERREEDRPAASKKMPEGQLLKLRFDDEKGIWVFEGPEGIWPEIEAILDKMKEEIEDLPVAPDIRIYRVRYIDVYSAMDIINEMFNATRQQRQQVAQQRQQQLRQQQAAQRQQQQKNQKAQKGQSGDNPRGKQRGQQQRQQPTAIQLPPTTVRVYPNPRDRTLILRADASQYPQIRKLLATIDQPKPIDSFMRTYPLKNLNAKEVEDMLKDMLGLDAAARRRGRSPRPRAGANRKGGAASSSVSSGGVGAQLPETILQQTVGGTNQLEVDPGDIKLFSSELTNSIMVMAPTAALDYIGKIIDELDKKDRLPGRITKYYTLKHAEANEVVEYLASHFGTEGGKGGKGGRGGKAGQGIIRVGDSPNTPTIIGYPRLNQITVIANESQVGEIEPIIKRLDVPGTELKTETMTLEFANPEDVAESINQIFEDRQKALKSLESKMSVSPFEYTVVVTPDVQTKQIIVQASDTNMDLVKARVAKLDTESATSVATEIRTYPIKYADPNAVVNIINQWAKSRTQSGGRNRTVRASDTVLATAEPTTQMVVVVASDENHVIIADLINRLDDEKFATQLRKRQVLRLKHASAAEVANQLTQVFRNAVHRQRSDRGPTFIADPKTNFIIADVNDEELTEITELLTKIDIEPPLEGERTTEVYPLRYADPGSLNGVVLNMFRWDVRSQPSPSEQVTSAVEGATQSLIVTASAKNHARIKEFIEKVDVESNMGKDIHLYKLQKADAAQVAETLQQAYRGRRSTRRGDQPVQITPERSTNSLLIFANAAEMSELETLIKSIDVERPIESQRVTEVYPLRYADPGALNAVVLNMFRWDVRTQPSPAEQVTSAVEGATQSLIVTASVKNHARIKEFIEKVDVESNMGKDLQLYKLEKANAEEVAETLQKAYRGRKSTRRGDQPVQITPEPSTNSLLIFANKVEMAELETLIKSIDVEPSGHDVNVVSLKHVDADSLAKTLNELYGRKGKRGRKGTIITAIPGARALVVKSNLAEFNRIKATIAELDTKDSAAGGEVRMVTLFYADATEIFKAMQEYLRKKGKGGRGELLGGVRLSAMGSSNSIMIAGAKEEVERLEVIIQAMDTAGEKGSVPQIIPIQYSNVGMIVSSLQEVFKNAKKGGGRNYQPPVIVADEMGNNLIVRAAPKDMQAIEDLVAKIDTKDKKDQTPYKILSLPAGMNPFDTAAMVEQTINETQRQRSLNLKSAKVANITVTSDRRTNSITIAGSASLFADAEAYVKQLQEMGPPGGTATRVMKVRNVALNDIQRLIDQLTQQGSGGSRGSARRGSGGFRRSGNSARRGGGQQRRPINSARRGGGTRRSNSPLRRGGGNRRGRRP